MSNAILIFNLIQTGENMSKQKIITAITVLFIIVSGIYYCVSFGESEEAVFVAEETSTEGTIEFMDDTRMEGTENVAGQEKTTSEKEVDLKETGSSSLANSEQTGKMIYVHICGQVNQSGVYCLEEGSRIMDVVEMAGGFTEYAAGDYVNLAQKLIDGQQIYIPDIEEVKENKGLMNLSNSGPGSSENDKVNINTADKDTLMTLTGIGEAKAEAIIKYREKNGGYKSIEEIKEIEGIKDAVFSKIEDEIEV